MGLRCPTTLVRSLPTWNASDTVTRRSASAVAALTTDTHATTGKLVAKLRTFRWRHPRGRVFGAGLAGVAWRSGVLGVACAV